jgi:hypothetical protein
VIPEETIRFFYIDDAWMDCLIDGALSVGNHLEADDDQIKTAIKSLYNVYLSTTVTAANMKPQIPCYGFVFRSQLVKVMPDLKIFVSSTLQVLYYVNLDRSIGTTFQPILQILVLQCVSGFDQMTTR